MNTIIHTQAAAKRTAQVLAAATAITAAGLTIPAPAQAHPMLPLAPACTQFAFPGAFVVKVTDGWQIVFNANGTTLAPGETAIGVYKDNVTKDVGYIKGGGIQGRTIDFTLHAGAGTESRFTGTVGDDGWVHGGNTSFGPQWDSGSQLTCADAPPPAPTPQRVPSQESGPAQKTLPPGAADTQPPPALTYGQVASDVDLYDAPGGNGKKIEILRQGRNVTMDVYKPKDWCHVVNIPAEPGVSGWVWGGFIAIA